MPAPEIMAGGFEVDPDLASAHAVVDGIAQGEVKAPAITLAHPRPRPAAAA